MFRLVVHTLSCLSMTDGALDLAPMILVILIAVLLSSIMLIGPALICF
jgi:hypothetical protein